VIVGTADAAAEAVSVGVVAPGQMMLMYGSTIFMYAVQAEPKMDRRLWAAPYVFRGTSSMAAGMATGGALTRWFRDQFAADLIAGEKTSNGNAYAQLAQAAAQVAPGAEGLLVLPYFSGERTPINDPRARGVVFGLTLAHTRAHVFRAILEGIAFGIRTTWRSWTKSAPDRSRSWRSVAARGIPCGCKSSATSATCPRSFPKSPWALRMGMRSWQALAPGLRVVPRDQPLDASGPDRGPRSNAGPAVQSILSTVPGALRQNKSLMHSL